MEGAGDVIPQNLEKTATIVGHAAGYTPSVKLVGQMVKTPLVVKTPSKERVYAHPRSFV